MAKKEQVPAIRFQGFADPWEQRKLSDLAEIVGGGTPDTNNSAYWDGDIDWYAPAEMEGQRYATGSVRKITELGLQKSSAKILPAHRTVLFTSRAGIGKMAILQRPAATNQGFQSLVLKDGTDPYFIYSMGERIKGMAEGVASGSTFLEISGKMLGNLEVMVPNLKEQESIATFFRGIDDLITLHQREYDKLVAIKRSMLEKMFPREGSRFPEIRFAGFTDPWEQRKLSEVVGVYDGVHQTPHYTDSGVMFLSVENIATLTSQKFISEEAFERDYRVYPQKGDVLMTRIGDVGTPNVVETSERLAFYVSLALLKPIEIDSYFLCNAIQSPRFKKGLKDRTLVTAIPQKINKDEIGKVDILMPESASEQAQIGTYFHQLDTLITLHQRKLEKLQAIKRSMLEKMFV